MTEKEIMAAAKLVERKRALQYQIDQLNREGATITYVTVDMQTKQRTNDKVGIHEGEDLRAAIVAALQARIAKVREELKKVGVGATE